MRALPVTSVHRCGVFTAREAAAAGWTRDALRHAVATGRLLRVRAGCVAPPPAEHLRHHRAADLALARASVAATLTVPDALVSHLGAVFLQGLPSWAAQPRPCVTTAHSRVAGGVHTHRVTAPTAHRRRLGGVAVTSCERTVLDVAREFGAEAALVVLDAAARHRVVDLAALAELVEATGRHADVAAARSALALLDARAESPLESRSRWHLARHGLPPDLTQPSIYTVDGAFVGRVDFFWHDGVVGEADGTSKYDAPDVLGREKWRQERLEELDLGVVRWGAQHLRDFAPTAARLERARTRARRPNGPRRGVAVPAA